MDWTELLRWAHILGACVLIGTGAGIAFFMLMAHRTRDAEFIARTAATVVVADWLFTATAVVAQPITGALLAASVGWSLREPWIVLSLILYVMIGGLWAPVIWLQLKMKAIAEACARTAHPLPPLYYQLYRRWFWCGVPAFLLILAILWIMVAKPVW